MKIGIDIDDTITNSSIILKKFIDSQEDNEELKNNFYDIIRGTYTSEKTVNFYRKYIKPIAKTIKVKPNAAKVIKKLHDEGNEIIIITARSDNFYDDAKSFCEEYLHDNDIVYDKLFTNQVFKVKTCINEKIDVMIDDAVDTCEDLNNKGIRALLFNSKTNFKAKTISQRVYNWNEVYEILKKQN